MKYWASSSSRRLVLEMMHKKKTQHIKCRERESGMLSINHHCQESETFAQKVRRKKVKWVGCSTSNVLQMIKSCSDWEMKIPKKFGLKFEKLRFFRWSFLDLKPPPTLLEGQSWISCWSGILLEETSLSAFLPVCLAVYWTPTLSPIWQLTGHSRSFLGLLLTRPWLHTE